MLLNIPFATILLLPSLDPLRISYPIIDVIGFPFLSRGTVMFSNCTPSTVIVPVPKWFK